MAAPAPPFAVADLALPAARNDGGERPLPGFGDVQRLLERAYQTVYVAMTSNEHLQRPRKMKRELRPLQKVALNWMLAREAEQPSGGILADDMGTGKTASVIALILKSKERQLAPPTHINGGGAGSADDSASEEDEEDPSQQWAAAAAPAKPKGGTLIVCVLSLMHHWEKEIIAFVKSRGLSVTKHHGSERNRDPKKLAHLSDVVITTYDIVRQEAYKGTLSKVRWERIVLDEAHEVRNPDTMGCKAVSSLEAKHRWCVTGTPLHNCLLDLYAYFKFLRWEPFDDREMWDAWIGAGDNINTPMWTALYKASILRRLKSENIDSLKLPAKEVQHVYVDLDMNERDAYDNVRQYADTLQVVPENDSKARNFNKKMHAILIQRQMCNHPSLIKEDTFDDNELVVDEVNANDPEVLNDARRGGPERGTGALDIKEEWNGTKRDLQKYCKLEDPVFDRDRPNSKMEKMLQILKEDVIKKGDKAVIVSQWTKMLEILSSYLHKEYIDHRMFTGSTPNQERTEIVDALNDPDSGLKVVLLSLKAGGVGLNLIGANHLFLYDIHWNPQRDSQACDRVYRMGQTKKVFIYKFIVKNSIEEEVFRTQEKKLNLAEEALREPSARNIRKATTLDSNDQQQLLQPEKSPGRGVGTKRKATDIS